MPRRNNGENDDVFTTRLERLLNELVKSNRAEIFGALRVDFAEMDVLAMLKANRIFLSHTTKEYPDFVLKYILAHELAHLVVKGHTNKFWAIVKHLYPEYEEGKSELSRKESDNAKRVVDSERMEEISTN